MKYDIHVNQKKAFEVGIRKGEVNLAHIFDLLMSCSTWATPINHGDEVYYWVARQQICNELPLLNIKPDTAYRHLVTLDKRGLIDYQKQGKKDLVKLTKLGRSYYVGNKFELSQNTMSETNPNSDLNPRKLGNESEKRSDLNPTYPNTNNNPNTKEQEHSVRASHFEPPTLQQVKTHLQEIGANDRHADPFWLHYESNGWQVGKTEMKNWQASLQKWVMRSPEFEKRGNSDEGNKGTDRPDYHRGVGEDGKF